LKINRRSEILNKDLLSYNPVYWGLNLPVKNYTIRLEDTVPALSGAIGKVALVAAFALAWARGLGISDPSFITENVRLEIILGSLLTLLFCSLLNPYAAPPGTLAPLIPIVPLMVSSGVHPLVLGILIGCIGITIAVFKYFDKISDINGAGTKGGIILLFGIMGVISSLDNLKKWTLLNNSSLFIILLLTGLAVYLALGKLGSKWLVIPAVSILALLITAIFGFYPEIKTAAALPILNPRIWWFDKWGIGWGLTPGNFVKALPFALLAVVMWPTDALAIKTLQEVNYPEKAKKSIFDMTSTFLVVSIRNIAGAILGGSQTSAIWRSFMIPLSIVKRPIGGSALFLGIAGITFGLLGFPLDIAVFPPLIWLVLIFGVFMPLIEIGLGTLRTAAHTQIAALCLLIGLAVNPVLGWITAVLVENLKIIRDKDDLSDAASPRVLLTLAVAAVTIASYVLSYIF
jgi:hypothetical protein